MWRNRSNSVRPGLVLILIAASAGFPLAAVAADPPPTIAALLPAEAKLGRGNWDVIETEFGKTFGADLIASSFNGQRPSCAYSGTPELLIGIKGDTAFENPPMLDMAVAIHDQEKERAPAALSGFINTYIVSAPDVVSVGPLQEQTRPDGYLVYIEYKEDCSNHPNGMKTRLKGLARRGATQLEINLVVALDGATAVAMAADILQKFAKLDIAALTE